MPRGEPTPGRSAVRRGPWLGGLLTLAAGLAALYSLFGLRQDGRTILLLIRSLATMTYLNIHFADEVSPFSRAISYYVFVDDGRQTFAVSVTVLAVAAVALLVGMARHGIKLGAPATALFAVWCASLTLCAIFPTDNGKSIVTASGMVHQVAGASLFVSLPLAGLSLAQRLATHQHWARTANVVRRLSLAAVALAAAYLATRLPDIFPGLAIRGVLDGRGISGLVQRVLFGLETVMLLALAVRLLRVCVATARERRQPAVAEVPG